MSATSRCSSRQIMDNPNTNNKSAYERSDEELSWDAEFADMDEPRTTSYTAMLADLAKLIVQVPAAVIQMPMALLPEETARHARAAAREGDLALRSPLPAIGGGNGKVLPTQPAPTTTPTGPRAT